MKYFISFACWMTGFLIWGTDAVNYFNKAGDTHSLPLFGWGIVSGISASAFLWWAINSVIDYMKDLKEKEK